MSSTLYEEIMRLAPLAYLPLADAVGSATAADVSGNGRNGTVHGTVTFGQSPLIKASTLTSAGFSSSYISMSATGLPNGANPWSIIVWAYPTAVSATYQLAFFGTSTTGKCAQLYIQNGQFFVSTWGNNFGGGAGTAVVNTTYLVVGTYDGTHIHLYLNNAQSLVNIATTPNISLNNAYISNPNSFSGVLAHVGFLNFALTPDQITRLWNVGQGAEGIVRGSHRSFGRVM